MTKIIDVKNLSFSYGRHVIFDNISFEIEEGNFTTFIDTDNNGKSTLARILACNIVTNNNVRILNRTVNDKNLSYIKKNVSFVSENIDGLFIVENVYDNIIFVLKNKGLSEDLIRRKVKEIIGPLELNHLLKRNISELSTGEKYLLAIFTAIASEPKILILDNAFSMIDEKSKKKILVILKALNKKGMTILNFTSNNEEILQGTSLVIIKEKKILLDCKIENAFDDLKLYEENNINLPFIVELSSKLIYYKKIDKIFLNMKELVNALWQ